MLRMTTKAESLKPTVRAVACYAACARQTATERGYELRLYVHSGLTVTELNCILIELKII